MKALASVVCAFMAATFLAVMPAAAQSCAPFEVIVENLLKRYQEVPQAMGQGSGFRLVVFADAEGDTFTIIGLRPDGVACQIVSGTGWEVVPAAAPEANL